MKLILSLLITFGIINPVSGFASIIIKHAEEAQESGGHGENCNGPVGNCSGTGAC